LLGAGDKRGALEAAESAVQDDPMNARGYRIRSRIKNESADFRGASRDIVTAARIERRKGAPDEVVRKLLDLGRTLESRARDAETTRSSPPSMADLATTISAELPDLRFDQEDMRSRVGVAAAFCEKEEPARALTLLLESAKEALSLLSSEKRGLSASAVARSLRSAFTETFDTLREDPRFEDLRSETRFPAIESAIREVISSAGEKLSGGR
jgi:hypothetical protein